MAAGLSDQEAVEGANVAAVAEQKEVIVVIRAELKIKIEEYRLMQIRY